ncbi:coenzyme F420-0:L-glutamate ligase [Alloiococcus otitis]|uniref:coenzyme F420-0:L-glutamate ligase n=1 Tax=Alloiococcus otitis TaxID=1652 RepID=UPI0023522FF0|nr:coenzyme F420-0:L-glutamate ligase [Alloiococcus otitis]
MERAVGTVVRGLRGPIVHKGDDMVETVVKTILQAADAEKFEIKDRDIVTITESVVARAQGNYASLDQIAQDIKDKFQDHTLGLVFPILSRNRFANLLKGIARGAQKIVLLFSYPADEVGNHLISLDQLDKKGVNPWSQVLDEGDFRELFGYQKHPFTGIDYIDYYKSIVQEEGAELDIIFSNDPRTILDYTKHVLTCDIHNRKRTQTQIKAGGADLVYGLEDVLSKPVKGSGHNSLYGLLGSNRSTEESVKLFPEGGQEVVEAIQAQIKEKTGKTIEVMINGDGAFKDPVGQIWELADPIVSPAYTQGLEGTPSEIKLKYLADNNFAHLEGEELKAAVSDYIKNKDEDLVGSLESQGTTPRRLTDLIGSLADLTSGSGDKGTPFVYIQGYFDNFTD